MAHEPESIHCRLCFLLARNADTGVIFRRGPSKWVQIIRWDTARQTFEPGQWFHGRIYEKRCDLSPDGELMIYFAQKINRRTLQDTEYTYAWTAISRPPYLTALALWPKGDCWHGGGLFETNKKVWLNHKPSAAVPHPNHPPKGLRVIDNPNAHGEDGPVIFRRLERDGWVRTQELEARWAISRFVTDRPAIYKKSCSNKPLTLVIRYSLAEFSDHFEFIIRYPSGKIAMNGVEWADWDRHGNLLFARAGKLFSGSVDEGGQLHEKELADFDAARPEQKRAPASALRW